MKLVLLGGLEDKGLDGVKGLDGGVNAGWIHVDVGWIDSWGH